MKMVTSEDQVEINVLEFQESIGYSIEVQDRLGFPRSWIAIKNKKDWVFGFVKYVGYQGISPDKYIRGTSLDGRKTEKQLQKWYREVPSSSDLYDELYDKLVDFLSQYNKTPSSGARINISRVLYDEVFGVEGSASKDDKIVDLMVAVAETLSPSSIGRLREALA